MRMSYYSTNADILRFVGEIIYIILLGYNMLNFIRDLKTKSLQYQKWWRNEVDILTEIEKEERQKIEPEWLRKFNAIVGGYTYFDFIYFALSVTSIATWVLTN